MVAFSIFAIAPVESKIAKVTECLPQCSVFNAFQWGILKKKNQDTFFDILIGLRLVENNFG